MDVSHIDHWVGLQNGIHIYPGSGTADGKNGDHILLAPAFNINDQELDFIVERVTKVIVDYFDDFDVRHH
jgi:adenosylmethionine-8-amino-7-oxononanoate aminotransferase